jgi:putative PIN family toxin of toxin-antitoxin system
LRSESVPLRVLIDVNVWVSYLLPSSMPDRPVSEILRCARTQQLVLVVLDDLIDELEDIVRRKPYLSQRIPLEDVDVLIELLRAVGEGVTAAMRPLPSSTRDPKDDYLIAAAIGGDVDILVSGDADLLALRDHLDRPRIMTARELVDALEPE